MDLHLFTCSDCSATMLNGIAQAVTCAAEWHNTNTGHDVNVIYAGDEPAIYGLTDGGWKNLTTRKQ